MQGHCQYQVCIQKDCLFPYIAHYNDKDTIITNAFNLLLKKNFKMGKYMLALV